MQRSNPNTSTTMGFYKSLGTISDQEQIKIKYSHVGGTNYELWIWIAHYSKRLWMVTLDDKKFLGSEVFPLTYWTVSIDYVARHLFLLTLSPKCNAVVSDRRVFWIARKPGHQLQFQRQTCSQTAPS